MRFIRFSVILDIDNLKLAIRNRSPKKPLALFEPDRNYLVDIDNWYSAKKARRSYLFAFQLKMDAKFSFVKDAGSRNSQLNTSSSKSATHSLDYLMSSTVRTACSNPSLYSGTCYTNYSNKEIPGQRTDLTIRHELSIPYSMDPLSENLKKRAPSSFLTVNNTFKTGGKESGSVFIGENAKAAKTKAYNGNATDFKHSVTSLKTPSTSKAPEPQVLTNRTPYVTNQVAPRTSQDFILQPSTVNQVNSTYKRKSSVSEPKFLGLSVKRLRRFKDQPPMFGHVSEVRSFIASILSEDLQLDVTKTEVFSSAECGITLTFANYKVSLLNHFNK